MIRVLIRWGVVGALLAASLGSANAAEAYVSATVEGVLAPGVYGRINIGNNPPPPVVNTAPVIITNTRAPAMEPIYVYAPPGHIQNWRKHCHRYNACGRPVYFVNVDERGRYVRPGEYREHEHRGDHDRRDGWREERRDGRDGNDDRRGPGRGEGHRDR